MPTDFFSELPHTTRFLGVVERTNFFPAPADWIVVLADIRSSTKAVNEGRYKDVNMIGGAAVCAARNAVTGTEIPFIFGGDGATLLIPAQARAAVEAALVRTRTLAREDFELDLRIGFVPVSDIRERQADVLVARYEVTPGNSLAMFGGGGAELADQLVKEDVEASRYAVPEYDLPGLPDLTGLSCRWEPLRTQRGSILCLLVKPNGADFESSQAILGDVLRDITEVVGDGELANASPVSARALRFGWPPRGMLSEAKATRGGKSLARRYLEVLTSCTIQLVLERFNWAAGSYNAPKYREELRANSDYCRFDDVLRMVLDCTPEQVSRIREVLHKAHEAGDIDFGSFEVEQALMTCLLFDLAQSQHVHFIDGDDGGFWSASVEYKSQLSKR